MSDVTNAPDQYPPISTVTSPLDRRRVGDMTIDRFAGLTFREYREAIEFCKLITQAKHGLPAFLKNNAPDCLILTTQALRWKLEPAWVMQHSYISRADGLVNFENFIFAAILLASGLLKGRPRYSYSGEGEDRQCTVSAIFVGEAEAHEYTTPPLRQCRPARNAEGTVKGSPLWTRDPDQQLGYYAIRNWGRRYAPELLGGVYSRDEFDDVTQEPIDVTPPASPNLLERLPGKMGQQGFRADAVDPTLAGEAKPEASSKPAGELSLSGGSPVPPGPENAPTAKEEALQAAYPDTAPAYIAFCQGWIRATTDPDNLAYRWDSEAELRRRLKISPRERKALEAILQSRQLELGAP